MRITQIRPILLGDAKTVMWKYVRCRSYAVLPHDRDQKKKIKKLALFSILLQKIREKVKNTKGFL